MSRKGLLVLAASRYQLEAIQTARRLGYRVVTTDNVPDNPGHALADASYAVDITDREAILDIATRERVAGVVAVATDVGVPTRAYVTQRLGLPGPPLEATATVCDKVRMRAFLRSQGLPVPESYVVTGSSSVDPGLFETGWWILKPDCSSGAKGVRIIDSAADYRRHLPESLAFSPSGTALLERFVEGHQGTCEGIIEDGQIRAAFFLDRQTVAPPYVTTSGHYVPTVLPPRLQCAVLRQLSAVWQVLGVHDEPFDCDFVATEREVFLLDLSPRVGGNSIPRLLRHAADYDLLAYAVRRACGESADLPRGDQIRPTGVVILGVESEGPLQYEVGELLKLRDEHWVAQLELDFPPDTAVQPFTNSRHRVGEALVRASSREEVESLAADLRRRLALHVARSRC